MLHIPCSSLTFHLSPSPSPPLKTLSPNPLTTHQVYAHPEHADAVHAIYEQTTRRAQSSAEPDVIHYCLMRDAKDPSIFHFFERYRNKEAFRVHNEQEIIQKLVTSGWIKDVEAVFGAPIG
ncbi:MAG: hypothetical protein Q9160_007199 [Pyrenula sp. 1 TL-2023]